MLHIGCHLSSTKGFAAMGRQALELGADTFQFFTRNPRGSRAKDLDTADAAVLADLLRERHFAPIIAHAPYTLNACALDEGLRAFARDAMREDVMTLDTYLPHMLYNFHPGSHVGQGTRAGIDYIAATLKNALRHDYPVTVLLETMAGKGSEIGGRFEELKDILDAVGSENVGVCLDTCHVYDGGYDIVNDLDGVLAEFDRVIGLDRLHALHLNDSKTPFASHKDRHECLGKGSLGLETFRRIVNHPQLKDKPMILETPNELPGYAGEIKILREMEA